MTYSKIAAAAAALLAVNTTVARADAITYDFTATVTSSTYGYYTSGESVSGSFTYQTTTGQPACDGAAGLCQGGASGVAMTLVPSTGTTPMSVTANANYDQTGTEYIEYTSNASALALLYVSYFVDLSAKYNFQSNVGAGSFGFDVNLRSSNGTLQSAPNIGVLPALSNFDLAAQISYDYISPVTNLQQDYTAQLTSLTLQPAPEPASLALLGSGIAALVMARRRR